MTPMIEKNMLRLDKRREKPLSKQEKFSKGISRKETSALGMLTKIKCWEKHREIQHSEILVPTDSKAIAKKSSRSRARQVLSHGSA